MMKTEVALAFAIAWPCCCPAMNAARCFAFTSDFDTQPVSNVAIPKNTMKSFITLSKDNTERAEWLRRKVAADVRRLKLPWNPLIRASLRRLLQNLRISTTRRHFLQDFNAM